MNRRWQRAFAVLCTALLTITGMGSGLHTLVGAFTRQDELELPPKFSDQPRLPNEGRNPGRPTETRGGFYSERALAAAERAQQKWSRQSRGLFALLTEFAPAVTGGFGTGGGSGLPGEGRTNGNLAGGGGSVNTGNGNLHKTYSLTGWPSRGGMAVDFTIYHNSLTDDYDVELGAGWSFTYGQKLDVAPSGTSGEIVTIRWGDGTVATYDDPDNNGVYTKPPGLFQTLTKLTGGNYKVTTKDGIEYVFTPPSGSVLGNLVSITDRNGNSITTTVQDLDTGSGVANRVTAVTDTTGSRSLSIVYDTNYRIDYIQNPEGERWYFDYDAAGDLIEITHPDIGTAGYSQQFAYVSHQIVDETDLAGNVWHYTYYMDGKLEYVKNPLGSAYDIKYIYYSAKTRILHPDGNYKEHYFSSGLLSSVVDEEKYPVDYADYNSDQLSERIVDQRGNEWIYNYDANGNLTKSYGPLTNNWTYTYNSFNLVATATDPYSKVTTYYYDSHGNLEKIVDANSKQLCLYGYNSYGDISWSKDYAGNQTDYNYGGTYGQLQSIVAPDGKGVYCSFDIMGRLSWVQNETQNGTTTTDDRTDYTYDEWGRKTQITHPIIGSTRSNVQIDYDAMSRVLKVRDELSHETENVYNAAGWLTDSYNELDDHSTYNYNSRGFVTSMVNGRSKTTYYGYTARGDTWYLKLGDSKGETWTRDGTGNITQHEYRQWGIVNSAEPRNYTYDVDNRLTYVNYNGGTSNVTLAYDNADRITSMVDGTGTTSYYYNDNGSQSKIVTPQGENRYGYDNDGRMNTLTEENGATDIVTTYTRDSYGRVSNINKFGEDTVLHYNQDSQLDKMTYGSTAYALYGYDGRGRVTSIEQWKDAATDVLLAKEENSYDAASRITQRVSGLAGSYRTQYFEYDYASQLTREYETGVYDYTYTYDANGNRASKAISGSYTETYTNDDGDKLTKVAWTIGSTNYEKAYTYHFSGRPTKIEYKSGTSTPLTLNSTRNFTWDKECRLTQIDESGSSTANYAYNGVDARVSKTVGSNTTTFMRETDDAVSSVLKETVGTGDPTRFLPGITERRGPASSPTATYFHSGIKSDFAQTSSSQSVTSSKDYDAFGNEASSSGWNSEFSYGGQFGYQTDDEYGLKLLGHRFYDASVGRFLTRDPSHDGRNWYTYCDNNPVWAADPEGEFLQLLVAVVVLAWRAYDTYTTARDIVDDPTDPWNYAGLIPGGRYAKYLHTVNTVAKNVGRTKRFARQLQILRDAKVGKTIGGWLRQEYNNLTRKDKGHMRNPPGYQMRHRPGKEASKGYSYLYSDMNNIDLHENQSRVQREIARRRSTDREQ